MPGSANYDTLEFIVNAARLRGGDATESLSGDIFTDGQPFTLQAVNNAWRRLQCVLAGMGYWTLVQEVVIPNLAPAQDPDPAVQASISWTGYSNGTVSDATKYLPQNLIEPWDCWERASAVPPQQTGVFNDMDLIEGALPMVPKNEYNQLWSWRDDVLYVPGATVAFDLRIRYGALLPDFATFDQKVPIVNCVDAFSNFICAEMTGPRGDVDAAAFDSKGVDAAKLIAARNGADSSGFLKNSERGKMRDGYTPGGGQ